MHPSKVRNNKVILSIKLGLRYLQAGGCLEKLGSFVLSQSDFYFRSLRARNYLARSDHYSSPESTQIPEMEAGKPHD